MAGRPTKLTEETTSKLTQAISVGATYEHACGFAGIWYTTMLAWMKKGETAKSGPYYEFYKAIKEAEAKAVVKWSALIDKAANDGEWQAAAWKLERRYPHIYGRRVHQIDFSQMSDAQLSDFITQTIGATSGSATGSEAPGA